jgi:hypothetical protein
MLKVLFLLAPIVVLSGCCRVFGICTDVSVQSAIDRPENLAQQQNYHPFGDPGLNTPQNNNAGSCTVAMR